MKECFKCGAPESKRILYEAILEEGIVDICNKCSINFGFPVIKNKTGFSTGHFEKKPTVYERLSKISGINKEGYNPYNPKDHRLEIKKEQEITLKDLVDRNFKKVSKASDSEKENLVKNFHWILMRARRSKCLTQKRLAENIKEPEEAIIILEKGDLPKGYITIIKKIEDYFRINLFKEDTKYADSEKPIEKYVLEKEKNKQVFPEDVISFDPVTTKNLTIHDIKKMKKKVEEDILGIEKMKNTKDIENFEDEKEKKYSDNDDLSQEEIDDLIYGRK